jgi:hypothetical protein
MELTKDRMPLWQAIPFGLGLALVGLAFGWLGKAFILDGLGAPLPAADNIPGTRPGEASSGSTDHPST